MVEFLCEPLLLPVEEGCSNGGVRWDLRGVGGVIVDVGEAGATVEAWTKADTGPETETVDDSEDETDNVQGAVTGIKEGLWNGRCSGTPLEAE